MKHSILSSMIYLVALLACNPPSAKNQLLLQIRIDSLEKKLEDAYKPGFGEFMSGIQVHHAKLWFAGQNENWKLADFEIHEIQEALDDIKKYCADRPETKDLSMLDQPIDTISMAIQNHDYTRFNIYFFKLTNSCNSCHRATNHEFNVITTPKNPPFSNQDFEVQEGNKK